MTHSTITLVKILLIHLTIAFALSRRVSTVSNGGEEEDAEEEKKKPEFLEPAPKRRHIDNIAKNLSGRI